MSVNQIDLLQRSYKEVSKKGGFYDFVYNLRVNPQSVGSVKIHDLKNLFDSSTTWTNVNKSSGHVAYVHSVTHVKVEFTGHKTRKNDDVLPQGNVKHVLNLVQNHMNILANNVFEIKNWKTETPDYQKSLNKIIENR